MSTLSSANVTDVNLVLKECTHMRLCLNMLIFTHHLGNWLITFMFSVLRLLMIMHYCFLSGSFVYSFIIIHVRVSFALIAH